MTVYRAPSASATAEIREKGSRFRAELSPARDEAEALTLLEEARRREPDATHHCWAWRLGADGSERSSDEGEPAGTAGRPMLNVLRGAGLSDVLAVVTRWFGGTKLGKGGLARAYAGAVRRPSRGCPSRSAGRRPSSGSSCPTIGSAPSSAWFTRRTSSSKAPNTGPPFVSC